MGEVAAAVGREHGLRLGQDGPDDRRDPVLVVVGGVDRHSTQREAGAGGEQRARGRPAEQVAHRVTLNRGVGAM
jgi:hypothetical protein